MSILHIAMGGHKRSCPEDESQSIQHIIREIIVKKVSTNCQRHKGSKNGGRLNLSKVHQ